MMTYRSVNNRLLKLTFAFWNFNQNKDLASNDVLSTYPTWKDQQVGEKHQSVWQFAQIEAISEWSKKLIFLVR